MNDIIGPVDRGQVVYLTIHFAGPPDEVNFTYIPPGESRPRADPGYGQPRSRIQRLDDVTYEVALDTTGMRGGVVEWRVWSTGEHQASVIGGPAGRGPIVLIGEAKMQLG